MKNFEILEVGKTYIDGLGNHHKITEYSPADGVYPYSTETGRCFMSCGHFDRTQDSEYDLVSLIPSNDEVPEVPEKKLFLICVDSCVKLVEELPQGKKIVVLSTDSDEKDVELVKNVLEMSEMTRFYTFK